MSKQKLMQARILYAQASSNSHPLFFSSSSKLSHSPRLSRNEEPHLLPRRLLNSVVRVLDGASRPRSGSAAWEEVEGERVEGSIISFRLSNHIPPKLSWIWGSDCRNNQHHTTWRPGREQQRLLPPPLHQPLHLGILLITMGRMT